MRDERARTELLADGFMRLKGHGVSVARLARCSVLRDLADLPLKLSEVGAGCEIGRYLVAGIKSLPEREYLFEGKWYPAKIMREGLAIELALGQLPRQIDCPRNWRVTGKAPARQCRLMLLLKLMHSYDQWRRDERLERRFLTILAEHLDQTAK
jgi:hypothetical protein